MDLNSARIILTQMQGCFKELDVPFVNESEMHSYDGFSNAINFRSWLEKKGNLAEIVASAYPSHGVIQLTMNSILIMLFSAGSMLVLSLRHRR